MLEVVAHAQDGGAENIDGESAQGKGRRHAVEAQRGVEAQKAAQRREDAGHDGLAAPELGMVGEAVGRPDGHEDGAQPRRERHDDDEPIEGFADEVERECGREGIQRDGDVRAYLESAHAHYHGEEDDGNERHETVSAIPVHRRRAGGEVEACGIGMIGRRGEIVGQGEEGVAQEGTEGGEGAAEAGGQADIQGNGFLDPKVGSDHRFFVIILLAWSVNSCVCRAGRAIGVVGIAGFSVVAIGRVIGGLEFLYRVIERSIRAPFLSE